MNSPLKLTFILTNVKEPVALWEQGNKYKQITLMSPNFDQVSGADRLPADQPARSCGLLPQHRVPAVQQREGLHDGPGQH